MYFFLVGFAVMLHVFFWGVGGALLVMPRPWARYWPQLVPAVGLALQSLAVWVGAYANLSGTDHYAWWSEVVPAVLLAVGVWRRGGLRLWADLSRFWKLGLATIFCLCALLTPVAIGAKGVGLTSVSLGSCDAADYAAGAAVLKEFARSDREGFLGLTEVVSVMSADNFFDYCLRLNHFTPAALIALNGTVVDCEPYELTSIMTVVLLASSLPMVFWIARSGLRYGPGVSLWIALLYGFSPVTWYAVFQVAMGQLLAAHAIVLITWGGIALWRGRMAVRSQWAMGGVLFTGYSLLLGSYNFILLVALVPAVACVGGLALWQCAGRKLARWALAMAWPLAASGLVWVDRVTGLAERFRLLRTYDFGWQIPALSPEGWLGMLPVGHNLVAFPTVWRLALALTVVLLLGAALLRGAKRRRPEAFLAIGLAVPALIGYGYLNLRGVRLGNNASYDAYKLFSVFFPGLLAATCYWSTLLDHRRKAIRWSAAGLATVVTGLTAHAAYRFAERMEKPPLSVGRELVQTRKILAMTDVASINMRLPDMWSRLWANALLLRKAQYFSSHTYEGRRNTPLRGDWDLNGGLIEVRLPEEGSRRLNAQFSIANTHSPYFLRAQTGEGWYDLERQARAVQRWRWTKGNATIILENPGDRPLHVVCRFLSVHSLVERDFQVWVNGERIRTVQVQLAEPTVRLPEFEVPPGVITLEIRSSTPVTSPGSSDTRPLGFRIFGFEVEVMPHTAGA